MTGRRAAGHSVRVMKMLLAALAAGLIVVATASASPPPQQLIGKWTRTVTQADVQREHVSNVIPGLTWTLVVTQHGSSATTGGGAPLRGSVVPSNATQVNIELGQQKPNLYQWRRSGKKLTLRAVVEPVSSRAAVLVGVWKKR